MHWFWFGNVVLRIARISTCALQFYCCIVSVKWFINSTILVSHNGFCTERDEKHMKTDVAMVTRPLMYSLMAFRGLQVARSQKWSVTESDIG